MCILIKQPAGHVFSNEWLADFYSHNPDGIGVMWAKDGIINVAKTVPNNVQDVIDFYTEHVAGKECALHLRWTTHGDTDLTNCHPYEVMSEEDGYPVYLMHNGVLSTGNQEDKSKSDTYLYIKNIIRPALLNNPTAFMEPWFKTLIEDHIGYSNKFVMMDAHGNTMTFNESAGVMWGDVWMSNTYAFDSIKAGVKKPAYTFNGGSYGGYVPRDSWDEGVGYSTHGLGNVPATVTPIKKPVSGHAGLLEDRSRIEDAFEQGDAWDYADMFLDTCLDLDFNQAYTLIPLFTIKAFYLENKEAALEYLGELEMSKVTEAEVLMRFIDEVDLPETEEEETDDEVLGAEGFVVTEGHLNVGMA